MINDENTDIAIKLRRFSKNLYMEGVGYVYFGIWSVLKVIMSVFTGELRISEIFGDTSTLAIGDRLIIIMVYTVMISIICLIVLFIHLVVGVGAMKASRGAKKRFYLILAVLFAVINGLFLPGNLYDFTENKFRLRDTDFASFFVDLTVEVILLSMIYAAIRIKQLTKQQAAA